MEFTIVYTPQQNDISERKNKTLIEVVLAMLTFAKLPKSLQLLDDCILFGKLKSYKSKIQPNNTL
jgi:hypothetical protein